MNSWPVVPLSALLREVDRRGFASLDVLSVYRNYGVILKDSRHDNYNKTPENLDSYKLVNVGDVVINKMKAWSGSLAVSDHKGIVSGDYMVCAVVGAIDRRYLHYALRAKPTYAEIAARSTGIRPSQWRLYWEDLRSIRIPYPPETAQRTIADYLDREIARIEAVLAGLQDLLSLIAARRLAVITEGCAAAGWPHERSASGLPYLDTVPSHWQEVKLSLVARLGSGHTPSREHPEWWVEPTIPWITTGEVWQLRDDRIEYVHETREQISELGLANSAAEIHPAGTVFLSRTASAGFSGIMARDMATSQDFVTWTCGPLLRPRFLLLCLRAMRRDLLERLAMGSTHKTIYMPEIQSIRIPLPPIDEQDEIVEWVWERLRSTDAASDAIARQIELLAERRQALITAAVTGQIDIPGVAA